MTIPNSVTGIGQYAFDGCRLENVMARNSKTTFSSSNAFNERTYQHAMLYIPEGTWSEAVYDGSWYLFNNIKETTIQAESLSSNQAYTLMDTKSFGYAVYDAATDDVKMVKAFYSMDDQDVNSNWIVRKQAGRSYLYNLGARKYATIATDGKIHLTDNEKAVTLSDGENGIVLGDNNNRQWGFVKSDSQPDATCIAPLSSAAEENVTTYYSLDGKQLQNERKGMNIAKMSNGKTRKIIVK